MLACTITATRTHQLFALFCADQTVKQIQDLDPQHPHIRTPVALSNLEVHKGLAQQRRRPQARLRHALRIERVHLRLQQLIQDGKDDAVEDLLDLTVVRLVVDELRTEQQTL